LHPYSLTRENRWFTLITSGFIHADLWHLAFNMLSLYFFAGRLEGDIGTDNFLIIYFASMIISGIPTVFKHRIMKTFVHLGASGAVSAIIYSSILFIRWGNIHLFYTNACDCIAVLFLVYGYYMEKRGMILLIIRHITGEQFQESYSRYYLLHILGIILFQRLFIEQQYHWF